MGCEDLQMYDDGAGGRHMATYAKEVAVIAVLWAVLVWRVDRMSLFLPSTAELMNWILDIFDALCIVSSDKCTLSCWVVEEEIIITLNTWVWI